MKIAFAVSEMVPFAKTGGLADMAGSLSSALQALGHEVAVFLPLYKGIDPKKWNLKPAGIEFTVPLASDKESGKLWTTTLESGVKAYFIDHSGFYGRDGFYGTPHGDWPDNDRRFIFFQRAVLESLDMLGFKPDILHSHDWQAGLLPVYLKTIYAKKFSKTKSVFTIHNLAYQGNFPPDSLPVTGLGWEQFRMERLEFYGKISFLKGAILDGDAVTTVSERYSQEIQTREFGCGLEGVLIKRREHLHGIVNGIDPAEWDPETDKDLAACFGVKTLEKKAQNKALLQKENGLAIDPKAPLVGMVSRLVDQKGMDILIPALSMMTAMGVQFVLLGTGEERYHQVLRDFAKKNKGKAAVHILFDPKMAKHIYAGSDMFLVPSYYEPCGLGQMIAFRYGTIPVVRETGGLADTVKNYEPKTAQGTGFSFRDYTAEALVSTIERAVNVYRDDAKWSSLVEKAMELDFSWSASAKKYVKIYETCKRRPVEDLR